MKVYAIESATCSVLGGSRGGPQIQMGNGSVVHALSVLLCTQLGTNNGEQSYIVEYNDIN